MHFRATMTVRLRTPLPVEDADGADSAGEAMGYVIIIGVNAEDIAEATAMAQAVALRPRDEEGNWRAYDGYVEEAEVQAIDKQDWGEEILAGARNIDRPGVYYSTALILFGHDAHEADGPHDARKWWQFWR